MKNWKLLYVTLTIPVIYLFLTLFTLDKYGVNWDTPKHLIRGHSYLHYIQTGKHDFLDMPPYPTLKGAPDYIDNNASPSKRTEVSKNSEELGIRRSYFQSDFYTFDYYMHKDERVPPEAKHSHPEVNDLFTAFANYIFFQKLGLMGDLESHYLFIVLPVFMLGVAVSMFVYYNWGVIASLVASSSLFLLPLVFSESHFNIKDPPLMAFFGLAILTFWFGVNSNRVLFIIISAIFTGLALGTKFNTVFLPLIVVPWYVYYLIKKHGLKKIMLLDLQKLLEGSRMLFGLLLFPIISLGVLFVFSPYLWENPIKHFFDIINYYREIGTGAPSEQSYIFYGWNFYPLLLILYTTPLPVLTLSVIGLTYSLWLVVRKKSDTSLLLILWFFVPLLRAVWPGMNILGDIRHILEFTVPFAIFSGLGAFSVLNLVKTYISNSKSLINLTVVIIFASLTFVVYELVKIHPNENVYFNQLIGGLSGAKNKEMPLWGNTYGNVYLQGINWLNENAKQDAKVALGWNYISSIPRLKLRKDIDLNNAHWSGPNHKGEYVIEMYFNNPLQKRYKFAYYEKFLNPVHEVKVDGVPLLKIWKNDREFLKDINEEIRKIKPTIVKVEIIPGSGNKRLRVEFEKEVSLMSLVINHSEKDCQRQEGLGYMTVSPDGQSFNREQDLLIDPESPYLSPEMDEDTFVFMFPARTARIIILDTELPNPCILKDFEISTWVND